MMPTPTSYTIGTTQTLSPLDAGEIDRDPRGIIWLWEPPRPRASYVMGIDPTMGIPNWDRMLRTRDDITVDNGAITVLRIGQEPEPDVQVAEYAAPIDPEDLGIVANALGRLYGGSNEDGQCLSIIEVYPGPGLQTLRKMITLGYTNQYVWTYLDALVPHPSRTGALGWTATAKSVTHLWVRGAKFIHRDRVTINSPWLIEEMRSAEMDPVKMSAKAAYGAHDDRLRALLLTLWAGHHWTMEVETEREPVLAGEKVPSWQASDISAAKMWDEWEERFSELTEG